jgi:predicted DNA-binding protein (MmcQ/YjbR family)
MQLDTLRDILLAKTGASEETPFGPDALVYKVMGKMYALVAWRAVPLRLSLKCDPTYALALRDRYAAVGPGYHLNKRHWNTVTLDGTVPPNEVSGMIDHSYDLVVDKLPKAKRRSLEEQA